jgi:hypothetical protein
MEIREVKGIQIAEKGGLEQTKHGWLVPAQGGSGIGIKPDFRV